MIVSYEPKLNNHTVNNYRNEKLYIRGGKIPLDTNSASDTMIIFDLKTCSGNQGTKFKKARCTHSSVIHKENSMILKGRINLTGILSTALNISI